MKLVLGLNDFGWPIEPTTFPNVLRDIAGLAEAGGFDSLGVPFPPSPLATSCSRTPLAEFPTSNNSRPSS